MLPVVICGFAPFSISSAGTSFPSPLVTGAAYFTFTKKWILNSIIATLMMFVFETYISCEMLYAGMYFSEEPKNYMLGYSGGEGYLGTGFSTIFIIA